MSDPEIHFVEMKDEDFAREAVEIVSKAQERGVILRILGAMAVYLHTEDDRLLEVYRRLGRFGEGKPMFTDLDLIAYRKQVKELKKLFETELKFTPDWMVNRLFASKRLIYYHPDNKYHVDIFLNKLEFSHDVNFGEKPGKGRLELDFPTITLADIVLEKLQIHHINLKDIVDLIVLLLGHEVASNPQDRNVIDGGYIAKVLADDWGFWYDATNNLKKVREYAKKFMDEGKLSKEEYDTICRRVDTLLDLIEREPKTKRWMKRAKVGTSKPWYREVEEIVR